VRKDLPRRAQRAQRAEKRRGEEKKKTEEEKSRKRKRRRALRLGVWGAAVLRPYMIGGVEVVHAVNFRVGVVTLCELPGHEPRCERGNPGDGQQCVDQCAEKIIGQSEGDRWDVPVGLFQVNLISFTSHGVPVGYNIY
jgi:hypothetical protein